MRVSAGFLREPRGAEQYFGSLRGQDEFRASFTWRSHLLPNGGNRTGGNTIFLKHARQDRKKYPNEPGIVIALGRLVAERRAKPLEIPSIDTDAFEGQTDLGHALFGNAEVA